MPSKGSGQLQRQTVKFLPKKELKIWAKSTVFVYLFTLMWSIKRYTLYYVNRHTYTFYWHAIFRNNYTCIEVETRAWGLASHWDGATKFFNAGCLEWGQSWVCSSLTWIILLAHLYTTVWRSMQIVTQEGKPNSLQIAKKHQHNNDRKTVLKHTKEKKKLKKQNLMWETEMLGIAFAQCNSRWIENYVKIVKRWFETNPWRCNLYLTKLQSRTLETEIVIWWNI